MNEVLVVSDRQGHVAINDQIRYYCFCNGFLSRVVDWICSSLGHNEL